MAELTTLARPYARAAFEVAQADNQLPEWLEALTTVSAVVGHEKVAALLAAPGLSASDKSSAVAGVLGELSNPKIGNFLATLAENKRLTLLPYISELFVELKSKHEKVTDVAVSTAYPIDEELMKKLTTALTKALQSEVRITADVDESLLGGVVVRAGDTVIDSSVKGQLAKLAETVKA